MNCIQIGVITRCLQPASAGVSQFPSPNLDPLVPEPDSMLLLSIGMVGLAAWSIRHSAEP